MTEMDIQTSAVGGQQRLSARSVLRKHAAILVTVLLFGAGAYALYHLLAPLDLRQVMLSLRAASAPTLILAMAGPA